MTVLNNRVRDELNNLIRDELRMVDTKAQQIAEEHWNEAEREVAKELGYGDTLLHIEHLQNEIQGMQSELNRLEGSLLEKAQNASQLDYKECGIEVVVDQYGRLSSRNYPRIFGKEIRSIWDTKILKHLNNHISFFQVYQNLNNLHHSVKREIILTGTFERAREVYQRFHVKVSEAIGSDMPKLMNEVDSIPALKHGMDKEF